MLKNLTIVFFITLSTYINAQTTTTKDELALIETPEQVKTFLDNKKSKKNKIVTFNQEIHKSVLAKELFDLPKGGIKTIENEFDFTHYKVIEKNENTYYRVSYIELDNKDLTLDETTSLQEKIIKEFEEGIPFDQLFKRFSIEKNANNGGDTGWFLEKEDNNDFKKYIINDKHAVNDIFSLFLPLSNKYFVVLKTYEPKIISEMKVLKIVEPKS